MASALSVIVGVLCSAVLCVSLLGVSMLHVHTAHASGPAAEQWKTISTPHFRINYHRSVSAIAEDVARMCEDAHDILSKDFEFTPDRKTEVVLLDGSESANGSANTFPRATIRLYAVPSASYGTRTDTAHWMWEMILHEYAHILHMEQIYGWIRIINIPFGRKFMPNQNVPRWFLEGTATAMESRYTGAGRARSNFYRMYLDAAVLQGTVPTLAQLTHSPPKYPYANFWYLIGGYFVDYIGETYGWDALFTAYKQQARRLRPWAVNFMIWRVVGKTFDQLYIEWLEHVYKEAKEREAEIGAAGILEPERITTSGHNSRWIAATLDGASPHWIRSDGEDDATLVSPENPDARQIRVRTSTPFSLFPDGKTAVIHRAVRVKDGYMRNDLWRVDLEKGRIRRLTRGLRASQPAVSPDGKTIAYVRPQDGRFDLYLYDLETKRTERISKADDWTTYSQPAWAPDGQTLYASLSTLAGGRNIYAFDMQSRHRTQLTEGRSIDDSPRISPDGRWMYYASDRDGTFNIYARDLSRTAACTQSECPPAQHDDLRVTRVRTGVFAPVVVRENGRCALWMSIFSAEGFDISSLNLQDDCSPAGALGYAPHDDQRAATTATLPSSTRDDISDPRRYLTGIRAQPWSWAPIYQRVGPHRQLGFSTQGEDPAKRFAWRADLSIGDPFNQLRWAVDMRFRMTTPEFFVNTSRSVNRGSLRLNSVTQPYDRMTTTVSVGTGYSFGGIRATQRIRMTYNWERREFWNKKSIHYDPGGLKPLLPDLGRFSNLYLSYSISNLRSYTRSISVERGWSASVGLRLREPWLGSDYQTRELSFSVKKAIPIPRWRRHALVLRMQGAIAQSHHDRQRLYSVGGLTDQNLWEALQQQIGASTHVVRGYRPGRLRGTQYLMAKAEYRFPLLWIDWGHSTLPLFFERVHGALYVDAATTFEPNPNGQHTLVGFGGELRVDLTAGYNMAQSFRLGVARGIGPEGIWQGYLLFGRGF